MRVLLLFEPGRAGAAAVELGRRLLYEDQADLTVVALAPQAQSGARCGNSPLDYNEAVRNQAAGELESARARLGDRASFKLLVEGHDPSLQDYAAQAGFDVIVLPARRRPLRSSKHPAAAALRRLTAAEIRIVDSRGVAAGQS
jgi:nucleotide-binding universal stress UspA family protein